MTVVAVTGSSGYLGRRLLEALEEHPDVKRVIGIDVDDPKVSTRNLEFYRLDMRSPAVADVIAGADVLVHLGFVLATMRDAEEMHDINVGGTRNVLAAASRAGVRKIVHLSSVMAYGAHPDNDFPLTEASPIRPVRGFPYSEHKAECEELIAGVREAHPDLTVTVLRPALVFGPTVSGLLARLIESPFSLGVEGYDPPLQCVHETDVARAIVHVIDNDLPGAFNLCADGWVERDEAAGLLGHRTVTLGHEEAYRRADRMWRVGASDLPPSYLPFVMYPWVMSNEALASTGFTFLHGNEETLIAAAEARRGWVSMGKMHFRPRSVALGLAGAVAVAGAVLRRRAGRREA